MTQGQGEPGQSGQVSLWGSPKRLAPLPAAFVNGVAAHAFELDDSGGCDHSGAVVVPSALAAATCSRQAVSGNRLIEAVVLGYDLGRRVQTALGGYDAVNERGWHSTGVCGSFASAAAASHLLGLSAPQRANAIGLAGSFTGGTWAFMDEGAMSKRMHVGRAAETGLNSAILALQGFTGPTNIFSASWGGFLSLYGDGPAHEARIYEDLGAFWMIENASIKPYASCRSTHSAIDALISVLNDNDLRAESIESIEVSTSDLIHDMCGHSEVSSLVSAQLSMPFALATAALHGTLLLENVLLPGRADARVSQLIDKVRVNLDNNQHGGTAHPLVTVRTSERSYTRQATAGLGGPENPMSDLQITQKFRSLATMRLSEDKAESLIDTVMGLEEVDDISILQELLGSTDSATVMR
jgi:2-methylcitrate dehydratase PrpD